MENAVRRRASHSWHVPEAGLLLGDACLRVLLIVPKSLIGAWQSELLRLFGTGPARTRPAKRRLPPTRRDRSALSVQCRVREGRWVDTCRPGSGPESLQPPPTELPERPERRSKGVGIAKISSPCTSIKRALHGETLRGPAAQLRGEAVPAAALVSK